MLQRYTAITMITAYAWIMLLFTGCKKVEKDQVRLNNQPSLVTQSADLIGTGQGTTWEDRYYYTYKTQFQVGDTMELAGRLFPETLQVQIGNSTARIIYSKRVTIYGAPGIPAVEADYIKLVITKEMGIGTNRVVRLDVNGESLLAPPVTIADYPPFTGRTDLTLRVDSLLAFMQKDMLRVTPYHIESGNVGHSGKICFYNRQAIYLLAPGETQPAEVVSLYTNYGSAQDQFNFNYFRAAALSWDEKTLYISGDVIDQGPNNPELETNPKARRYGVIRLVKLDLASREMTTINRSYYGGYPNNGPPRTVYAYRPGPGMITGPLAQVNLMANKIKVDADNNLYVENKVEISEIATTEISSKIYASGEVKTLFSIDSRYPGQYLASHNAFSFHPATMLGFTGIQQSYSLLNPAVYDFKQDEPLTSYAGTSTNLTFSYFDSSTVTGYASIKKSELVGLTYSVAFKPSSTAILSTGEMVLLGNDGRTSTSFNLDKKVAYTYAGAEINAINRGGTAPELTPSANDYSNGLQVQTAGPAKYVNFSDAIVLGVDEKNAIYFYRPPTHWSAIPLIKSARIYKLYKP